MNLSMPQIKSMMDGTEEVAKIQQKALEKQRNEQSSDSLNKNPSGKPKDKNSPQVNDTASLMGALGGSVKMTPKAEKKFKQMIKKKQKQDNK